MRKIPLIFFALFLMAMTLEPRLKDPALEARVDEISKILRCVTCESQSIYESRAPLAVDMRGMVRKMVSDGKSNEDIIAFMHSKYGDHAVMTSSSTLRPLWLTTLALAVMALAGWRFSSRRAAKNSR